MDIFCDDFRGIITSHVYCVCFVVDVIGDVTIIQKMRNWSKTVNPNKLDFFPQTSFRITTEDSLNSKYDSKRTSVSAALQQKLDELLSSKREEKEKLAIQMNEQFAAAKKAIDEQVSEFLQDYQSRLNQKKGEIESVFDQIQEMQKSTVSNSRLCCFSCED